MTHGGGNCHDRVRVDQLCPGDDAGLDDGQARPLDAIRILAHAIAALLPWWPYGSASPLGYGSASPLG